MYDFHFGSRSEIAADEASFLLGIKHLLPRWLNSIPDSEFLCLNQLLEKHAAKDGVRLVETGTGASTIVLLHHAMKYNGRLYTWDIANPKGSAMRSVFCETLCCYHECNLWDRWVFVPYGSTSPFLGLPVLQELAEEIDFAFLDSDHTWDTLGGELRALLPALRSPATVFIDDANYTFKRVNTAYVNMFRKKLGLPPVGELPDNQAGTFADETERLLADGPRQVRRLDLADLMPGTDDLFYTYYASSRKEMLRLGMEKAQALAQRYCAWEVRRSVR